MWEACRIKPFSAAGFLVAALATLTSTTSFLFALTLTAERRYTAFECFKWPICKMQRHLVFEAGDNIEIEVFKTEMAFEPLDDVFSRATFPVPLHLLQSLQNDLARERSDWYRGKVFEWMSGIELAESQRAWPPEMLLRIRELVGQRIGSIDYILAYRRCSGDKRELIGTVRRTISAEYRRKIEISPRHSRVPLILEELFHTRLNLPYGGLRINSGIEMEGIELNELGGFWVSDQEPNKLSISSKMFGALMLLVDDPRIPEGFNNVGRHWVMFTDRVGHRHFFPFYGFQPIPLGQSEVRWDNTPFFLGSVSHATLRTSLREKHPCGQQLLSANDDVLPRLYVE